MAAEPCFVLRSEETDGFLVPRRWETRLPASTESQLLMYEE